MSVTSGMHLSSHAQRQSSSGWQIGPLSDARSAAIATAAGGFAILTSAIVLAGWFSGNIALTAVLPGGASMKANAAIGILLVGSALCLVVQQPRTWRLVIARLAALTAALLGVATLAEYRFGWNLGIDELLVADAGVIYRPAPGRPTPATAVSLVLIGSAIIALRSSRVWVRRIVEALTLLALLISALSLIGYAYGLSSFDRVPIPSSMTLHTAVAFAVLCTGVLYARVDFEVMSPVRSTHFGGALARKLLPAILIIPLLGWLRLQGERLELYEREFGLALFTITVLVILIGLVWTSARRLNQVDVERSRVEEALRESERVYRAIGESIDYGVWLCDPEGKNVYASPSFLQLVGITQRECAEFGWGDLLHPDDGERTIAAWKECVRVRGKWDIEHRFRGVDGQWHSVLARGVPVTDENGKLLCWAGINLDISRLKAVEQQLRRAFDDLELRIQERTAELTKVNEKLRRSLEEKEVLLSEVHHRVKNNLQVVSSLLHLQSLQTSDPSSVEMFEESRHRVRSMALVHERLYRSKDMANIEFTDYIQGLADTLFQSYKVDSSRINLTTNVKGVRLAIDVAVPCGLLINELVSNCLKHAFVGRQQGHINIELQAITDDDILLKIADDGLGLPEGFEPEGAETFGMQVVIALVDQIRGRMDIVREEGTEFRIFFPRTNNGVTAGLT